jgi:hypothetical protein
MLHWVSPRTIPLQPKLPGRQHMAGYKPTTRATTCSAQIVRAGRYWLPRPQFIRHGIGFRNMKIININTDPQCPSLETRYGARAHGGSLAV